MYVAIPQHLAEKIKSIPQKPGIYKMKDINGNIIYIGKSKSLNSRVKSYFTLQHDWSKLKRLVFHIRDIDYIVTDTHLEAQILECALIKKLKPLFNAQFKNDNKYIYFKLNKNPQLPPITIVEEREEEYCLGPFRSRNILSEMILSLEKIYPILRVKDTYDFTYNILLESIDKDIYDLNHKSLLEIFFQEAQMLEFISQLDKRMRMSAANQQFETASYYRDLIFYIKYAADNKAEAKDADSSREIVLGEKITNGYKLFYISDNRIILKRKISEINLEVLGCFITQGREIKGKVPQRKEKSDLDFKYIINSEVQATANKAVLFIEEFIEVDQKNLENFISILLEK